MLDLAVEFERLPGGVSPNVEHYEVIDLGLAKKSRCGDLFGRVHFDTMTPQDTRAHPTGSLAAIDEENFLVIEDRAAKGWWLVHLALPKLERPLRRGGWSGLCSRKEGKSRAIVKSDSKEPVVAFGYAKRHGFRRAWYILRTGAEEPDWEKLGADYFIAPWEKKRFEKEKAAKAPELPE